MVRKLIVDTTKTQVHKSSPEPKEGIHESNQTYKERDSSEINNKESKSIKWTQIDTSENRTLKKKGLDPNKTNQTNKVNFFLKYSQQLESEKQKLLLRIKKLESENQEWEDRFRGSVHQREQIKESADKVMGMLGYLNKLIDKFVKPAVYNDDPSKSEKAILMDNLCKEKLKFDENMLGIRHKANMKKKQTADIEDENNSCGSDTRERVSIQNNILQNELNESIRKLEHLKNEMEDSVLKVNKESYTIQIKKKELDSFAVQTNHIKSMYFSEDKGLDCIPLDLRDLEKTHKTEYKKRSNLFKSKGRKEKISISISECNRLFQETLPNSTSRKRSRRKKSRRKRTKECDSISQTTTYSEAKKSHRETKSSIESNRYYEGLYNRNNSLFNRNRLNLNSKESDLGNGKAINVWDKYNMTLPGSTETKNSQVPLSQTSKYENSRFVESINQKDCQVLNDESFNSEKLKEKKEKIEFEMLKEKILLQIKNDEIEQKTGKIQSNDQKQSQEKINYLRPSDSLRQRYFK